MMVNVVTLNYENSLDRFRKRSRLKSLLDGWMGGWVDGWVGKPG